MQTRKEKYIPERHKVGIIIRTNNKAHRFPILKEAINSILEIESIALISIIISSDNKDSELKELLIKSFGSLRKKVEISSTNLEDFYTDILSSSIKEQVRRGIDYSFIISAEAYPYATRENISKMLEVAKKGFYSIGLILKEYRDLILNGYVSNAFCLYKNTKINLTNIWLLNALIKNSKINEMHFGMEEVFITKNIIENYGENSVAIVEPENGYLKTPRNQEEIEWKKRVHNSKERRFNEMCKLLQVDRRELIEKINIIK